MAIDTNAPIRRRGLLAAVVGGTAAALAGVAGRAERALAAGSDGETVVIGGDYGDVRTVTRLARSQSSTFVRSSASKRMTARACFRTTWARARSSSNLSLVAGCLSPSEAPCGQLAPDR